MERFYTILDVVEQVAAAHKVSAARVSLAWLLAKPYVTSVITGAKTVEQLNDNLAAAELALSAEEIKNLDQASELPQEYPGWMLKRMGQDRLKKAPTAPKPAVQPRAWAGAGKKS
jgi:diketogulonate reductase-like aldo/keto reductase